MKLTSCTTHALRSLPLVALKEPVVVRVDDMVRVHGLARQHILKIIHEFGVAGSVATQRGCKGAFRLARPAKEFTVGEVVRATRGPLDLVEGFSPEMNTCPLIGVSRLSRALREAAHAFMAVLGDLTLADIATIRGKLLARIVPWEEGITAPMRKAR